MEFRDLPLLTEPRNTCQGHELQEKSLAKPIDNKLLLFVKVSTFRFLKGHVVLCFVIVLQSKLIIL